jgi:hypothetical protein
MPVRTAQAGSLPRGSDRQAHRAWAEAEIVEPSTAFHQQVRPMLPMLYNMELHVSTSCIDVLGHVTKLFQHLLRSSDICHPHRRHSVLTRLPPTYTLLHLFSNCSNPLWRTLACRHASYNGNSLPG